MSSLLRNRLPLGRLVLIWAAALAIVHGASAAAAVEPDWYPLHAGNRWVYEVHRDHTYQPANETIDRVFHSGQSTQVAEPAVGKPAGVFVIRDEMELRPSQNGSAESTLSSRLLVFDAGLRMLGSSEARPFGSPTENSFEPPLRLLPTTTVGETWNVGTYREGALQMDLQGEIVGIENLTSNPVCHGCLKVRYRGKIGGAVPIYQGVAKVESGSFEHVMWFERGVGIVRDESTTEGQLRLPDGKSARIFVVLTMRLVEHAVAK